MTQNENDAQVHTVDELLTNIEQHGLSGQLFTQMALVVDMALTNAQVAVNDSRIDDETADWSVLAQLAEQTVTSTQLASRAAELMLLCAARKRTHN